MKFVRKQNTHGKITKTSEDILSELGINAVVNKIQNYGNKWVNGYNMFGNWTETDYHT